MPTLDRIADYIKGNTGNIFFKDLTPAVMEDAINLLNELKKTDNNIITINMEPEEIAHVEKMIKEANETYKVSELVKAKETELAAYKNAEDILITNATGFIGKTLDGIRNNITTAEKELETEKKHDDIRKYLILSSIAEEYIIGKIVQEILKNKKLKTSRIDNLETKAEYFKKFMREGYGFDEKDEEFEEHRFSLLMDFPSLTWQSDNDIVCCITNFQNVTEPIINRIVNSFIGQNTKKFYVKIFSLKSSLLTEKTRDGGQPIFHDYSDYTLTKKGE